MSETNETAEDALTPIPVTEPTERGPNTALEKAAATLVGIREKRAKLARDYEAADAALKGQMEKVQALVLKYMREAGLEGVRTAYGTMYVHDQKVPVCGDFNALYDHILKERRFDLLQRRLSAGVIMQEYETTQQLPPGVTTISKLEVRFQKPKK